MILCERYQTDIEGIYFLFPSISIFQKNKITNEFAEVSDIPSSFSDRVKQLYIVNSKIIICPVPRGVDFRFIEAELGAETYRLEIPIPFSEMQWLKAEFDSVEFIGETLSPAITKKV